MKQVIVAEREQGPLDEVALPRPPLFDRYPKRLLIRATCRRASANDRPNPSGRPFTLPLAREAAGRRRAQGHIGERVVEASEQRSVVGAPRQDAERERGLNGQGASLGDNASTMRDGCGPADASVAELSYEGWL